MVHALEGLVQDASSLHRLVDSVQRFCEEQKAAHAYRSPNEDFLNYTITVADETKLFLDRAVSDGLSFPKRIPILRAHLETIKRFWQQLHRYVKPAGDAHRLRLPAPLLDLATEHVQRVEQMSSAKVVAMLTPYLMYFQQPHTEFKKLTQLAAAAISGTHLPEKLGFVELPYSLAPNFLANLVVYHELGHFVWEEFEAASPPHLGIAGLKREMVKCLNKHILDFPTWSPEDRLQALEQVEYWTYEVFCDLFALRLIGPAFSFAAIEFFNLLAINKSDWVTFSYSHPAPCCRFYEHKRLLVEEGWWPYVGDLKSEYVSTIKNLSAVPSSRYVAGFNGKQPKSLISAFLALRPAIRRLVRTVTEHAKASPKDFAFYRRAVEDSFLHGVVPSTVVMQGKPRTPTATAIVNASVCFYLTSMPRLMHNLQAQDAHNVSQRSHWIHRLESWTMKAVEDVQLLIRRTPN
jgi:hypothetical protein